MTAYPIPNPFSQWNDVTGLPLSSGYIYIGEPSQDPVTHPIAVYQDAGLSVPFTQPLRTTGGFLVGTGTPVNAYPVSTPYSISVRNKSNVEVYYQASVTSSMADFIAALAASTGATLIGTSTGKTVQQELDAPSSLATDTGTTLVDHKYSGTGATKRTLAAIINEPGLSAKGFGAKGDGTTNDYTSFLNCLAQCKATGAPMFVPPGDYLWDLNGIGSAIWDPTRLVNGARRAIPIIGAGLGVTSIHLTNATGGLALQSSTDWFDPVLSGMRIYGSVAGPMLTLGKNDYSDPINMFDLEDLSIENAMNDPAAEGIRLNYIAGGNGRNVRAVCYANGTGTNVGVALKLRQAEFVSFIGGAFGNAHYSIHITDGFNFNCTFDGQTLENCDVAVRHDSANSGGHSIWGAQITNVTQFGIQSTTMLADKRLIVESSNFAALTGFPGAALIDPANCVGVVVRDRSGIATPAVPVSGATVSNTTGRVAVVTMWGGTVTTDDVQGFHVGVTNANPRTYIIGPNGTIGWTGAGAPQWTWSNLQA